MKRDAVKKGTAEKKTTFVVGIFGPSYFVKALDAQVGKTLMFIQILDMGLRKSIERQSWHTYISTYLGKYYAILGIVRQV